MKPVSKALVLSLSLSSLLALSTAHAKPMKPVKPGRWAPTAGDLPTDFTDIQINYQTLESMELAGLQSAHLNFTPWSGDYWPMYQGLIAHRYADDSAPDGNSDWATSNEWATREIAQPNCSVDALSPAEKYDLLIGDSDKRLTHRSWDEGAQFQRSYGKVETWMGICEGWSAAALMVPRPRTAITVLGADGVTPIRFYPDDIKALASLLWSRGSFQTITVGHRCEDSDPQMDSSGHHAFDPSCADSNPATWHMSMVHHIGVQKIGMVMDADANQEVWNQPLYSYSYTYFNPKTGQRSDLGSAQVALSDWPKDPYAATRSENAKTVVGIRMDVEYAAEVSPSATLTDDHSRDRYVRVTYVYDLELDESGLIVGGEWHQNKHPDFLWAPAAGSRITTTGDLTLDRQGDSAQWNVGEPVPASWRDAAREGSLRAQPLARIVNELVSRAAAGGTEN